MQYWCVFLYYFSQFPQWSVLHPRKERAIMSVQSAGCSDPCACANSTTDKPSIYLNGTVFNLLNTNAMTFRSIRTIPEHTLCNHTVWLFELSSCLVQTADHQYMFINQDFKVNIFLRLRWNDPRLAHNFTSKPIPLHPSVLSKIWKPDVYFSNEKHANFHTVSHNKQYSWI